jgi:hypothetical protein
LLVALAGLAVVVAAGVVVLSQQNQPDRVTRENYDRIHDGMSRAEVEEILGSPGDYRTGLGETRFLGRWSPEWDVISPELFEDRRSAYWWHSDSVAIWIEIDESGHVLFKDAYPTRRTQGPLDNLLWRAKRQWHRWFPE